MDKIRYKRRPYQKKEDDLKITIADYMNSQFPQIPFMMQWDHLKLPIQVAAKLKRMRWNNPCFTWPDMFIASPHEGRLWQEGLDICGIFLEIKRSREEIFTKNGSMRQSNQIIKENNSLKILRNFGFRAEFVWSIEKAIEVINNYLK